MEEPFFKIDPKNKDEQLCYPSFDFTDNPEIISPKEDLFFVDQTLKNEKVDGSYERIIRTDINTFKYKNSIMKDCVIILFVIGIVATLIILISGHFSQDSIGIGIFCFLSFFLFSMMIDCQSFYNIYLILEPNSIVFKKKSILRRKTIVYKLEELESFALYYKYYNNRKKHHHYILYFVKKNGKKDKFKEISINNIYIYGDFKGLKYFIDLVNAHINKNMK